jgi:tetratricopeptide (TPR) repeat protein
VFDLNSAVEASPYREVQDSPEVLHTYQMVQAKLGGYVLPVKEALARWPESDTSEPARYAHSMIYMRQPNFQKAMATINGLIAEEPNNPYFYEVRGQIYVSMAKPALAIADYQKSVNLRPRAPQLRAALGHRPARNRGSGDGRSRVAKLEGGAAGRERGPLHLVSKPPGLTAPSRTSRWPTSRPPSCGTMPATCAKRWCSQPARGAS